MNLKTLDRNRLIVAGTGFAAFLVAAAGFLLVVNPQRAKISSLNDQIATKQVELAGLHTGASTHRPDLHAAELFQLSRAMPDTSDQAGILLSLADLAQRAGVTLVGVQPQTAATLTDGATVVPLSVVVDGSWAEISAFLADLRAQVKTRGKVFSVAGRLFDVDQVSITATPASGGASGSSTSTKPGVIQATLLVNAFDYGTPPPPATSTSTSTTTTTTTPSTSGSQQAAGTTGGT